MSFRREASIGLSAMLGLGFILSACGGSAAPAPSPTVVASQPAAAKPSIEKPAPSEKPATSSKPVPSAPPSRVASAAPTTPPAAEGARGQSTTNLILSQDGATVYDSVNKVTWLADTNLPATNRFGLAACAGSSIDTRACVNTSGSMSYQAAEAWIKAMNAAHYAGHTNWQLPATPATDKSCQFTGPHGEPFGFSCVGSALGSLYAKGLGLTAPDTAIALPNTTVGPFVNLEPSLYWSQTKGGGPGNACYSTKNGCGNSTFSFNTGFHGANTGPNYLFVLPMIRGRFPGVPPAASQGLQAGPDKETVYDPVTNITWLADANLAATNTFGLPPCKAQGNPKLCVNHNGAVNLDSANEFIAKMNAAAYLGQKSWELPPLEVDCPYYGCDGDRNPMGNLFYRQLGLSPGTPVALTPNIPVGPFTNVQPYLYWSCTAAAIQDVCKTTPPVAGFEFSFSLGNGFQGTDILQNDLYVTAYYPGK